MDPRFKTKFVSDGRAALFDEVSVGCVTDSSLVDEVEKSQEGTSRSSGPHEDLWSCFNEIVNSSDQTTSYSDDGKHLKQEIDAFLALPLQPLHVCPHVWWHKNINTSILLFPFSCVCFYFSILKCN